MQQTGLILILISGFRFKRSNLTKRIVHNKIGQVLAFQTCFARNVKRSLLGVVDKLAPKRVLLKRIRIQTDEQTAFRSRDCDVQSLVRVQESDAAALAVLERANRRDHYDVHLSALKTVDSVYFDLHSLAVMLADCILEYFTLTCDRKKTNQV